MASGLNEISVDHAKRMARIKGFSAREEDGRLYIASGENNFSTMITDGMVSGPMFDKSMAWLSDQSKQCFT